MININHRLRKSQEKELLCRHSVSFQVSVVTVQIKTGRQNSSKFSCSFFNSVWEFLSTRALWCLYHVVWAYSNHISFFNTRLVDDGHFVGHPVKKCDNNNTASMLRTLFQSGLIDGNRQNRCCLMCKVKFSYTLAFRLKII